MKQEMTRKDFIKAALFVTGAGATLGALARCGGGSGGDGSGAGTMNGNPMGGGTSSSGDAGVCSNGAVNGTITNNHGHALSVPAADIQAATQKSYNIQGTSAHPLTLTAAHFALLAQNQNFVLTSTNDAGHTHDVTVKCA